jgi:thiopurine S-methyltransferase
LLKNYQMSSEESETRIGRLDIWEKRWAANQLRWHKSSENQYLINYFDLLCNPSKEPADAESLKPRRFFIPLCGKTMDIAFILSQGHTVFAVEGVKQAIEILNEENSFNLTFDSNESVYSNADKTLQIYLGNIFTCPIQKWGPFDCVWDRGSITAIDYSSHKEYSDFMKRSVSETPEKLS